MPNKTLGQWVISENGRFEDGYTIYSSLTFFRTLEELKKAANNEQLLYCVFPILYRWTRAAGLFEVGVIAGEGGGTLSVIESETLDISGTASKKTIELKSATQILLSKMDDTEVRTVEYDENTGDLSFLFHDNSKLTLNLLLEGFDIDYDADTKELVFTKADGSIIRVDVSALVDIYTGIDGSHIQVNINPNTNEIEAILKKGTITDEELSIELLTKIDDKADREEVDKLEERIEELEDKSGHFVVVDNLSTLEMMQKETTILYVIDTYFYRWDGTDLILMSGGGGGEGPIDISGLSTKVEQLQSLIG